MGKDSVRNIAIVILLLIALVASYLIAPPDAFKWPQVRLLVRGIVLSIPVIIAIIDIIRRQDFSNDKKIVWVLVVYFIPVLGLVSYIVIRLFEYHKRREKKGEIEV